MTHAKPDLGPLPPRIAKLPVDARGYPVPWFVAWVDGPDGPETVPEFRAMDARKFQRAVKERLCWVCGDPLGRWLAFPIGPMCAITRTTTEPPLHRDCAEWSLRHCPFLSQPAMVRREEGLPAAVEAPGGHMLTRNPGVTCLWLTRSFEVWRDPNGKPLLTVGEPTAVSWWREGRAATRAEVQTSIDSGLPNLLMLAKQEGPFAVEMLGKHVRIAEQWFPPTWHKPDPSTRVAGPLSTVNRDSARKDRP